VFALGARQRPATGMFARQFIQGGVQFARFECFANLDLLPAFPPVGAGIGEDILRLRLRFPLR
jgi:hypothetical protein